MAGLRKPRRPTAALRGKVKQIEERIARLEGHLDVVRAGAKRSRGLPRIRLKRIERRARVQIAKARRTMKDSAARLSRALPSAKTGEEVRRHVAASGAALQDSLDRLGSALAESTKAAKKEMGVLRRGLGAGLRAGAAAYRRRAR